MESISICAIQSYLPENEVTNAQLATLCGRPESWFEGLTGIKTRRRAAADENAATMGVAAARKLADVAPFPIDSVDLVIGASYTPWDTVGTLAHWVQKSLQIRDARVLYLSSACSSFLNALELAQLFAETGRSRRALIVVSEHNSAFARDDDERSGHLWGDGAAAVLTSADRDDGGFLKLVDIATRGLADQGHGPAAVYLQPLGSGLVMPHGHDVFYHACREMRRVSLDLLGRNRLDVSDVSLLVPHQANKRIIDRVAASLDIPCERVATTVESLGNTGCASIPLSLQTRVSDLRAGDYVLAASFGGGYSSGGALLRAR